MRQFLGCSPLRWVSYSTRHEHVPPEYVFQNVFWRNMCYVRITSTGGSGGRDATRIVRVSRRCLHSDGPHARRGVRKRLPTIWCVDTMQVIPSYTCRRQRGSEVDDAHASSGVGMHAMSKLEHMRWHPSGVHGKDCMCLACVAHTRLIPLLMHCDSGGEAGSHTTDWYR